MSDPDGGSGAERATNYVPKGTYAKRATKAYLQAKLRGDAIVAKNIQFLLWFKRMTQAELADDMGISVHALRDRLRGRTTISVGELAGIAGLLNVDVRALFDPELKVMLTGTADKATPQLGATADLPERSEQVASTAAPKSQH